MPIAPICRAPTKLLPHNRRKLAPESQFPGHTDSLDAGILSCVYIVVSDFKLASALRNLLPCSILPYYSFGFLESRLTLIHKPT